MRMHRLGPPYKTENRYDPTDSFTEPLHVAPARKGTRFWYALNYRTRIARTEYRIKIEFTIVNERTSVAKMGRMEICHERRYP